jgi:hypothetical protein
MQYPHPGKIKFNLHIQEEWNPYFFLDDPEIPGKRETWRDKLGIFYSFNSMSPPLYLTDLKRLNDDIHKAVTFGITAARSGSNYQTTWKSPVYFIIISLTSRNIKLSNT